MKGFALAALALVALSAQAQTPAMEPYLIDHRGAKPSPADLSFQREVPAGRDGFIRVQGEHLVKPNGKRIKFWGVHLTDWSPGSIELPTKDDIPIWASALARYGCNIVRLHFLDLPSPRGLIDSKRNDSQHFDPDQLDRLDFLVAELKKRGIYMDLNLNVGRSYKEGDGVRDAAKIGWAKGLVYFDPRLIELQKDYARQILTHVNPYTQKRLVDDPAVAIVEIVNENALYLGFKAPTKYYDEQLLGLYNAWLEKHIASADLETIRREAGVAKEAPIPRLGWQSAGAASKTRYFAEQKFFAETERGYYEDMTKYLRSLGVRQPIIATADHAHASSGYLMQTNLERFGILDGHDYYFSRTGGPMVNDPLNSTVVELSRSAIAGKPYTVSETNNPFPNPYACEGFPILAAYASLQDWDMVIAYTFEPKRSPEFKPYMGDPFDISHDPMKLSAFAVGSSIFLGNQIKAARQTVERTYSSEQVVEASRMKPTERPYFTPGFPIAYPLMHKVRTKSLSGPPTQTYAPVTDATMTSDTGELSWSVKDGKDGLVKVDSDKCSALIGFVGSAETRHLKPDFQNPFVSLTLSSLDGLPLAKSHRMLLVAGSKEQNTGVEWNAAHTRPTAWGGSPSLIETVKGSLRLSGLGEAKTLRLLPIAGNGAVQGGGVLAAKDGKGWLVKLGAVPTPWYVLDVER